MISSTVRTMTKVNLVSLSSGWMSGNAEYADISYDISTGKIEPDSAMYSPVVKLDPGEDYIFMAYFRQAPNGNAEVIGTTYATTIPIAVDNYRECGWSNWQTNNSTIRVNGTTYKLYYIKFSYSRDYLYTTVYLEEKIYSPYFFKGSDPSEAQVTMAVHCLTADEINLSIRDDLDEVGIKIKGNDKSVNLKADSVNVETSTKDGVPTMQLKSTSSEQTLEFCSSTPTDMSGIIYGYREWFGFAATSVLDGKKGDFLSLGARVRANGTGEGRLVLDDVYLDDYDAPQIRYEADMEGDYVRFRHRNDNGAIKSIEVGLDEDTVYITGDQWPTSVTKKGRVYVDSFGNLKVKGSDSNNLINYVSGDTSLTLPSNPVNGTIYFSKLSDSGTVTSRKPIKNSHDNNYWNTNDNGLYTADIGEGSHVFVYMNGCWVDFYCSA